MILIQVNPSLCPLLAAHAQQLVSTNKKRKKIHDLIAMTHEKLLVNLDLSAEGRVISCECCLAGIAFTWNASISGSPHESRSVQFASGMRSKNFWRQVQKAEMWKQGSLQKQSLLPLAL